MTLFGVMDLLPSIDVANMDCLDIGTANGLCAFHMAMRGGRVTATDLFDDVPSPFAVARQALNLDVNYQSGIRFDNILDRLPPHAFDVIVCAGVLYHMFHPLDAILKARKLARRNGLLLIETAFLPGTKKPIMEFNPVSGRNKELTTYWLPSKSALLGMLRFAGFDILAVRRIRGPDRIAVLARNVSIGSVSNVHARMAEIQTRTTDAGYIETLPDKPVSLVSCDGLLGGDFKIDWRTYTPNFPPHPDGSKPMVGKRRPAA